MANVVCPVCHVKLPRTAIVAYSYGMPCPRCGRALELSRSSRLLASFVGLAAAWLAYDFARVRHWGGSLDWVAPLVVAVLALGIVSPLFLLFSADLVELQGPSTKPAHGEAPHGHMPAARPGSGRH